MVKWVASKPPLQTLGRKSRLREPCWQISRDHRDKKMLRKLKFKPSLSRGHNQTKRKPSGPTRSSQSCHMHRSVLVNLTLRWSHRLAGALAQTEKKERWRRWSSTRCQPSLATRPIGSSVRWIHSSGLIISNRAPWMALSYRTTSRFLRCKSLASTTTTWDGTRGIAFTLMIR